MDRGERFVAIAFDAHKQAAAASTALRSAPVIGVRDVTMHRGWTDKVYTPRSPDEVVITLRVSAGHAARLRNAIGLLGGRIVVDRADAEA